ncbi:hypothetical protein ACVRW4_04170 [Streptococcus phocae subsp. phocae]
MSKYKIAAITAIAAMSLLTGATASADEVIQGKMTLPQAHKTSDLCKLENGEVTLTYTPETPYRTMAQNSSREPQVINIVLPGGRGSEGTNAEKLDKILKSLPYLFNSFSHLGSFR